MKNNNILISIEGNIGSGKTTFIKHLRLITDDDGANKDIIFVPEPVNEWTDVKDSSGEDILTKFYRDPDKYAFSFQMLAFFTRHKLISKALEENTDSIIITERSMGTDMNIFAQMLRDDGKLDEIEFKIYMKWFESLCDSVKVDKYIYLHTTPDISFNRILKRNRRGEENISKDYIKNCHSYHLKWINVLKNVITNNVITIDVSTDFYTPTKSWINKNILDK